LIDGFSELVVLGLLRVSSEEFLCVGVFDCFDVGVWPLLLFLFVIKCRGLIGAFFTKVFGVEGNLKSPFAGMGVVNSGVAFLAFRAEAGVRGLGQIGMTRGL
jgi:hypothetical protein